MRRLLTDELIPFAVGSGIGMALAHAGSTVATCVLLVGWLIGWIVIRAPFFHGRAR